MASYVLKHARVAITESGTSYNTATALLTVTASHLYIIKKVQAIATVITGGAIANMALNIYVTDNAGANSVPASPQIILNSAGAITKTQVLLNWAADTSDAQSTVTLGADYATEIAITDTKFYDFRFPHLKNMHLEAGQILKFEPTDMVNSATNVTTSNSTTLAFDISYIDYTL